MSWISSLIRPVTREPVAPAPVQSSFKQELPALLVTKELEKALDDCKKKVERISKHCRARNRKFRDIEFDLENDKERCLHGLSDRMETYTPSDIRRVTEIFEDPQFFVDGASSHDIVQGVLGDCWYLSALATIATAPGLVEKCCVARDEKVGIYGFIFFRDAAWVSVIIDDMLYTSIPKYEELNHEEKKLYHGDKAIYNSTARKGGKSLYFARSGTENETWVPLIEKAYAKLHGDYYALCGGFTCEAIEDLTGGVASRILSKDIFDIDRFWNDELLNKNRDRLFSCSFNDLDTDRIGPGDATDVAGLFGGHAYSVLRAVECKGKRFVVVRNPWGRSEWTGPWSDGSKEWTHEWIEILPLLDHVFGNDGQFIMEYKDFIANWQDIERTLLFDSTWVMSSHWLRVPARPVTSAWGYGDVSFTFNLPNTSNTVIVLSQIDKRYFEDLSGEYLWTFDFILYRKGDPDAIAESPHSHFYGRSVNLELELEAGEYVIHVRLDREFEEKTVDRELWNERKLAKVLTERAKSRSIAANVNPKDQAEYIPLPLEILAGKDIADVEKLAQERALEEAEKNSKLSANTTDVVEAPVVLTTEAGSVTTSSDKTTVAPTPTSTSGKPHDSGMTSSSPEEGENELQYENDDLEREDVDTEADKGSKIQGDVGDKDEEKKKDKDDEKEEKEKKKDEDKKAADELEKLDEDDEDSVFIGLRVYSNKNAPAVISGQLRNPEMSLMALLGSAT